MAAAAAAAAVVTAVLLQSEELEALEEAAIAAWCLLTSTVHKRSHSFAIKCMIYIIGIFRNHNSTSVSIS